MNCLSTPTLKRHCTYIQVDVLFLVLIRDTDVLTVGLQVVVLDAAKTVMLHTEVSKTPSMSFSLRGNSAEGEPSRIFAHAVQGTKDPEMQPPLYTSQGLSGPLKYGRYVPYSESPKRDHLYVQASSQGLYNVAPSETIITQATSQEDPRDPRNVAASVHS